jgi:hypothetical protein
VEVPLALLEPGFDRREFLRALLDVGDAASGDPVLGQLPLVGVDLLGQRTLEILLTRQRGGELGLSGIRPSRRSLSSGNGGSRRRRSLTALSARGRRRPGERCRSTLGRRAAAAREHGPQAGTEAALDVVALFLGVAHDP